METNFATTEVCVNLFVSYF